MPVDPKTGNQASIDDSQTWSSVECATYHRLRNPTVVDGIGFVFDANDPFVGFDLDNCVQNGSIDGWAWDIVESIDSYTELSPSETGVHIILEGELPSNGTRRGDVEVYDDDRYFTVSGLHLKSTPTEPTSRQRELEEVYDRDLSDTESEAPETAVTTGGGGQGDSDTSGQLSDAQILEKATQAANGDKFEQLWSGATTGYESHSEADMALCSMLAFWTGGNSDQIDRLFRQSGLHRAKWDEPRGDNTYGELTISAAIQQTEEFYGA